MTPSNRIIVVGGGTAGWMTAAALARFCHPARTVTLVESDAIGTVGVGEATIPAIRNFNNALGIDEAAFLAATGGTYKLGIAFEGWGAPDEAYMHAFGVVGRGLGLLPFHHYWLRARADGLAKPLGHYVFNTVACGANRFAHIDRADDSPLPPVPYAFHFDAGLYAKFLRGFAEARGVIRVEGRIDHAERSATGDIAAVVLDGGTRVAGDLFIDCSGFGGLLIEREMQAGFEDWSHWLPCDRAVAVPCESVAPLVPYTRSIARRGGWQWRIPLQHRIGNGHVFSSAHLSEDEATATLLANLDGAPTAEPRTLRFSTGKRRRAFVGNVVAIGLSSGFLEPLESTSIHLIQTGVNRLLDLLPAGPVSAATRDEYNRQFDAEMASIRDFIILHYHANGRIGEPLWDQVRAMPIPDSLTERLDLFRAEGRIFRRGDELFDVPGWVQVMIGQGVIPRHWHPIADQASPESLRTFLDTIEGAYLKDAGRLPEHAAYIARFAPMPPQQEPV
ncbi:tryptophan halogenase family protein [Sphingomonas sp.]|uniref:tryptophan halogenase family protein n=1 Tax=Sphingomonas sp. TaxID=28214 RepID=UPI001EB849D6|nr:tryptophan halogenase family protein [Sphingomonas sp.]MBX3594581.1 tryptophan 7-halogenase [Sphingomonas sp.]